MHELLGFRPARWHRPLTVLGILALAALGACGGAGGAGTPSGTGSAANGAAKPPIAAKPNAQRNGSPSINVHFCTPKPAADPTDPCWKNATATPMPYIQAGKMPSGFTASFQAAWDASNLYVLEVVKNPQGFDPANANTATPWLSDAMELYLSGDNGTNTTMASNDTQIDVPLGQPASVWAFPGQSTSGVKAYVNKVSGGYDVMMAVPWADCHATPGTGQVIGINPATDTYSNGSTQNQAIAWAAAGVSEQNPSAWGQAVLVQ